MHDAALKELWRTQSIEPAPLPDSEQLARMESRLRSMNRALFWRDCRENIAAVFVVVCFGVYFFIFTAPLARAGSLMVVLSGLLVIAYPIWRKRRVPRASPDAWVMPSLECELRRVKVEIELLRSVHWWYILPGSASLLVFLAGLNLSLIWLLLCVLSGIAMDAFIYWINQLACDKRLLPLKRELESLIDFDGSVPPLETPRRYLMTRMIMFLSGLLLAGSLAYLIAADADVRPAESLPDPTSRMLEAIRIQHGFPALAAAVIVDGRIAATNAVGFRTLGGTDPVTVNDKFHIGSVTKSMTATIAAMLVEQGTISWTTTIGESFAGLESLDPDYRDVTLEQLLSHRGGAPGRPPRLLWIKAWNAAGSPAEQRLEFVKGLLARRPEAKPGTRYIYSNQGYAIAGVMLEKAAATPWEELMRTRLFEPLEMNSAGFGAPATLDTVDQPWGHRKALLTGIESVPPGPRADNPPAIGPAGTVHCSLPDLARYVVFHMAGEQGGSDLLKPASFTKLHTPVGDDYALGWVVLEREWAGGRALMHNGSNTMFYVVVWMAPDRNCAVIVATNIGRDKAFAGCDEAASKLIRQFFPSPSETSR
jgi:CubicO group peptidase (beta-lactamase class C family)